MVVAVPMRKARATPAVQSARRGEQSVLTALREGDERAFAVLVDRYHRTLIRGALKYVRDEATAEDVVQETWLGFLDGLDRFEGRCSLRTWLFRILFHKAQSRAARDERFVPFSSLVRREISNGSTEQHDSWIERRAEDEATGGTCLGTPDWQADPERALDARETRDAVRRAIDELPPAQGTVMLMRDVHGFTAEEACRALGISSANQRVLLHRARTRVRTALVARAARLTSHPSGRPGA